MANTTTTPTTTPTKKQTLRLLSDAIQSNLPKEKAQIWAAADPFSYIQDKDLSILDSKIKIEILTNPVFGCYQYANEETKLIINQVVALHKANIDGKGLDKVAFADAYKAATASYNTASASYADADESDDSAYASVPFIYAAWSAVQAVDSTAWSTVDSAIHAARASRVAWSAANSAQYAVRDFINAAAACAAVRAAAVAAWNAAESTFYIQLSEKIIELIEES